MMLLLALGMVIGGETRLKEWLSPVGTLVYWLLCLLFTALAIIVAFLDVWALQRRTRQEQRELFESTLTKIRAEAKTKPRR
jgi:hypothetical protein